jgi:UDP-2,4-diacetamido-2,4,6-trideoxy-beta-L-altropyranose hydrolase
MTVSRLLVPTARPQDVGTLPHSGWLGASWQEDARQTRAAIAPLGVKPTWLVVDHYALDRRWEQALRPSVDRIMVIDDLADRPHDCDLLLDQNYYADGDARYDALMPSRSQKLLGPQYALLRPEFGDLREHLRRRDGTVCRVLVSFGGGDATTEILKTLEANEALADPLHVDVVFGASNRDKILEHHSRHTWATFYESVSNMAAMIDRADLFVGGAGSTTWERCCLGMPSITISMARNQNAIAIGCAKAGACLYLGPREQVTVPMVARALHHAIRDPAMVADMGARAARLADGAGTERVLTAMQQQCPVASV